MMDQSESNEKKPLSFGFSKRQETKQLGTSAVGEQAEKVDNSKDFVLAVEKNEVHSTKPTQKKTKEYIIPLIKQNKWRTNDKKDTDITSQSNIPETLDSIAAREILQESARLNGDWEERGITDTSRTIPLLMQNKVPEGFETEDKLNVNLRPEEPRDADYDQIPIEHFGMALLKGMGWKEGKGIGKNAKMIVPIEVELRPKGLGLGADRSNVQGKDKISNVNKDKDDDEKLDLKRGAHCVVLSGANKDLYGTVEGIDEDNARAMVKLSISGKVVNIMQCILRVVSKKDFEKHSKYINKLKVDKYKDEEVKRSSKRENKYSDDERALERSSHSHNHSKKDTKYSDSHRNRYEREDQPQSRESKKSKRSKHSSDNEFEETHKNKKQKHKHHKHHKNNKRSHRSEENDHKSSSDDAQDTTASKRPWIRKDLRVRIIDKDFKGGKYYKEKVIVEDVPSPKHCVCKTVDGRVIENISQSSLETVVPRTDDAVVMIICGSHLGEMGQIMKRDKDRGLALIQLLSDRDIVLRLQYDEICEYLGDVHFVE